MEYMEGGTLREAYEAYSFGETEIAYIAKGVCTDTHTHTARKVLQCLTLHTQRARC
jgi:serine/threonine protein kinase